MSSYKTAIGLKVFHDVPALNKWVFMRLIIEKGSIVIMMALCLVAIAGASANADIVPTDIRPPYNDPLQYLSSTDTPHGGYTTSTNKCKECHAVHLATGSYYLTRADARRQVCDFCHGIGGATTKIVVLNEEGHGLSVTQESSETVTAPDDTDPPYQVATSDWGCPECHSVHNNYTVKLAGYTTNKLLRADPNQGKTYLYYTPVDGETTQTLSQWCSTCHNANMGLHTDPKRVHIGSIETTAYGHDVSGDGYTTLFDGYADVNPDDGLNKGPTCKQCHPATGIGGSFPHSSENTPAVEGGAKAPDMLMSGAKSSELDKVCGSCHLTSSLP